MRSPDSLLDDQIVEQGKAYWSSWSWAQYLAALGPQLQVIVSFNYDLVIEHLLEVLGIGFGASASKTSAANS